MPENILLITVDDMNYNSAGFLGCPVPDVTPNMDALAGEGMTFKNSHVTVAICQPSRQAMMTGRYPHRNGAPGFDPIDEKIPTLQEELKKAGYMNGIIGKVDHLAPVHKYCWDSAVQAITPENGFGRDPKVYYQLCMSFLQKARKKGRPFFLMANSHDPHRPFAGSTDEIKKFWHPTPVSRRYTPEEVAIPGFLPDIPDVRREVAEYFTSVHRCDETVGEILRALKESGFAENTVVMFLSDNGMAFPFAKTNCYFTSTKTPWIVRWPGKIRPGSFDAEHFISGIDYMPTILDIVGVPIPEGLDGRSFAPILTGEDQEGRDSVYTVINTTAAHKSFPMRCIQNSRYGYIYNDWSDDQTLFVNESKAGLTYRAMVEAAKDNVEIGKRVHFFDYRTKEEFYDFEKDPDALVNLIDQPEYQGAIAGMKKCMLEKMKSTDDPLLENFIKAF